MINYFKCVENVNVIFNLNKDKVVIKSFYFIEIVLKFFSLFLKNFKVILDVF